jgi:phage terminase large subunit GpA-like protein
MNVSDRGICDPGVAEILEALSKAFAPPPKVDPIQWLETHRRLSPESSRELGTFHFSRAPYLIEPQRAILDTDTREVVLNWSSQCGKSELWLNALLYWSVNSPAPALVVAPDWKSCKSLSSDRIKPMARDAHLGWDYDQTREAQQLGGPGADNSAFRITLNGKMPLTIVHASSASALAQRPVKFLVFDEVSRMPQQAKGRAKEGDPLALGKIRVTTYGDEYKAIYVSSPVELSQCRITELYEASTRERWHSRCPECGHLQILRLPEMDFASVTCQCLGCGGRFGQDQWQATQGEWIALDPSNERRGFWLNVFASPFIQWPVIFQEWKDACHAREAGDNSLFRVVLGTRLTENFVQKMEFMSEPEVLMSRRERYEFPIPSNDARIVLAAIDTQKTWLEFLAVAVGPRGEMWALEVGTINGRIEVDAEAMYQELDKRLLNRLWLRPDGKQMRVVRAFQDSGGHATEIVHWMVRERARLLWAYRGSGDLQGPWKRGTDSLTHSRLIQGNANYLKETLATKLDIVSPGPGYIHFPLNAEAGFDEEFFEQLLSERREKKMKNGIMTTRWVQLRERNEGLDLVCMVICCALTFRGAIDTMEVQVVGEDASAPTPSRPQQPSVYGAQQAVA